VLKMKNINMYEVWQLLAGLIAVIIIIGVIILGELYSQLGRYSRYWQAVNSSADINGQVYVAMGDSAAQGVGASKPQLGYVGLIAEELEKTTGKKVNVINLSKSGAKVKDVLSTQLPAYKKLKLGSAPVITIEIGANDMFDFDPIKFEKEIDELMYNLPPNTVMSDVPYFGKTRFGKLQPNVEKANKIIYKQAAKHNLKLVPLHDKVKSNSGLRTLAADIFHPSNKAYRENWAPTFLSGIKLD
jgi:acyl-CoA thioesterase I